MEVESIVTLVVLLALLLSSLQQIGSFSDVEILMKPNRLRVTSSSSRNMKKDLIKSFADIKLREPSREAVRNCVLKPPETTPGVSSVNVDDLFKVMEHSAQRAYLCINPVSTNCTFATNTVDKLLYQLKNFEPMKHRRSYPLWNDAPLHQSHHALHIGMSTVGRRKRYLVDTLGSVISAIPESMQSKCKITVFNGNFPPDEHPEIKEVQTTFRKAIDSGLLKIIHRNNGNLPYPQMKDSSMLATRWGDSLGRVQWRSKQVLDVAFLMEYVALHSEGHHYFLMLEDDIIATRNFVSKIRDWVDTHLARRCDWMVASFYNPWEVQDEEMLPPYKFFGVIGQLFRVHDLPVIVEFLRNNFDQSPLDWLFVDLLHKFNGSMTCHTPSMFQHVGKVSSLPGKVQPAESVDFLP